MGKAARASSPSSEELDLEDPVDVFGPAHGSQRSHAAALRQAPAELRAQPLETASVATAARKDAEPLATKAS
jgi:hypothetical protein